MSFPLRLVLATVASVVSAAAGLHAPGNVPWPGGIVYYEFDEALTPDQKQTYLDGLREWELAANVHFVAHDAEPKWVVFKYVENGPNLVTPGTPEIMEIGRLTRHQICHEMGHSLGLEHEHQRADRDTYVTVNYGNVDPVHQPAFNILPTAIPFGGYDFESVMHYGRDVYSTTPGLDTITTNPGHEKYQRRLSNATLSPTDRAHLASLYGPPAVPLSSVVTTTSDVGPGSLRAAIYYAQDHPGATVTFDIPTSDPGHADGVFTIRPTGSLPTLAMNGLVIDATTQPGYAGKPVVFLNGSALLPEVGEIPGLLFLEANCTVRGLGIQQYPWTGVAMLYPDATGNRVAGCTLGLDATGTAAAGNAYYGAYIADGAHGNFIGGTGPNDRNVISGNQLYGVWISGTATTSNTILGNYIGTNVAGSAGVTNRFGGVILIDGTHHNTIGGGSAAARNVISGNTPLPPAFNSAGIWITGSGVNSNSVTGNYIGTTAAGTAALPNSAAGIYILSGASDNVVSGNVLSGNSSEGLRIADSGSTGNLVQGNFVGTSANGTAAVPNGFAGVSVLFGATGNFVGGTSPAQRNVLSGNTTVGLSIGGAGTEGNIARGNYIGTDPSGMAAVPNGFAGVYLTGGCSGNFLGDGPGSGNLISGNASVGVLVADAGTTGNFIRNNRIGPDAAGGNLLSPGDGIWLSGGAQSTLIGGTSPGAANIISGNAGTGIAGFNDPNAASSTIGHTIQRNSIFANGWQGIALYDGANHSQAPPVIASAVLGFGTTLSGTVTGAADTQFRLEFFSSPGARNFVGETLVTTVGNGTGSFDVTLPATIAAGREITATCTSLATGDTSTFSEPVTVTSSDTDNDGLPDAYESVTPGLSSVDSSDASLDNDGDGFTNLQEFIGGTNPNNSGSRLVSTGAVSGGDYEVSFGTVTGKFYRLESSDTLPGIWETVAIHVAGTGGVVTVPGPMSAAVPRRFFRVAAGE